MRFKISTGFKSSILLPWRIVQYIGMAMLAGCGGNQAAFVPAGVNCVLEQPLQAVASVPDDTGKLLPHTKITMPVGTIFTYDPKYQTPAPKGTP